MRRKFLLLVLLAFAATRLIAIAAAHLGALRTHPRFDKAWERRDSDLLQGPAPSRLAEPLVRWDALFYVALAREGYPAARPSTVYHAGFFPLYPLLTGALAHLGLGAFAAALLLSNLCTLIAALAMSRQAGPRAALLLLASPGAHFFALPYSEGLFAMLVTLGYLALRRGRPWLAGLAGGLASATRPPGVVLSLSLAVDAWKRRDPKRLLAAGLGGLGLVAFSLFCRQRYGDPLYWMHIQGAHDRHLSLLGPLKALFAFDTDPDYYAVVLAALAALALLWRRRFPLREWVGAAFLLLLPLATGTMKGMIRYVGADVPLIAGAPRLLRRRAYWAVLGVSLALMAVEAFLYGKGMGHN